LTAALELVFLISFTLGLVNIDVCGERIGQMTDLESGGVCGVHEICRR
jgi:hypothetical protein